MTAYVFPHGTTNGYKNLGCRCALCKAAWRVYRVEYRRRLRERADTDHDAEEDDDPISQDQRDWFGGEA